MAGDAALSGAGPHVGARCPDEDAIQRGDGAAPARACSGTRCSPLQASTPRSASGSRGEAGVHHHSGSAAVTPQCAARGPYRRGRRRPQPPRATASWSARLRHSFVALRARRRLLWPKLPRSRVSERARHRRGLRRPCRQRSRDRYREAPQRGIRGLRCAESREAPRPPEASIGAVATVYSSRRPSYAHLAWHRLSLPQAQQHGSELDTRSGTRLYDHRQVRPSAMTARELANCKALSAAWAEADTRGGR